jgi:sec-independent protein translocase protein TatA
MQLHSLAFVGNFFGMDGIVVALVGLLIFGRRLPEVGKNLGRTIVEFKKGLNGQMENDAPSDEMVEEPLMRRVQGRVVAHSTGSSMESLPSTDEL